MPDKIESIFGLKYKKIDDKTSYIHQWHPRPNDFDSRKESDTHPVKIKWLKNKKLLSDKKKLYGLK